MSSGAPAGERTVLCVEDVESSAQLVLRALRRIEGLRLVMAKKGSEARQLLESTRCDLVLTDLNLPDVSGAPWVQELVASADAPVVVVSADATPSTVEAVRDAGATGYLTKPVDLRQLMDVVRQLAWAGEAGDSSVGSRAPANDYRPPRALIDRFLVEAAVDLDRSRHAVAAGQCAEVAWLAHRLKGSAVVFGVADLPELLDRLSDMARDDDLEGAGTVLDGADQALACFRVDAAR